MRCFRSGFVAALSLIIVYGRPEDSYSLDSLDSTFSRENSYSFDSLDSTLTDPAFDNFYLDSPEFDAFSPNNPVYPLDQDSNTYSWDLASLPNCETQGSLTNDFLQARDETLCPTNEPEGNVNLPTQLFQDPLQYLNDGLKTPPVGQDAQPGPGLTDEDFNFNAFVRNRPKAVLNYVEDESICSRRRYGLSNTPVCHYPNRGSTPSAGVEGEYTLYDVSPCKYFISVLNLL